MIPKDYSFKWNLEDVNVSEYKDVHIHIDGIYEWGEGYVIEPYLFESVVYPELEKMGYIIKNSDISSASPKLIDKHFDNRNMDIYMHPMDFSGYAKLEDIEKITKAIQKCEYVKGIFVKVSDTPIYDLNSNQYKQLLARHTKQLAIFIEEAKKNKIYDIGIEFAKKFGLSIKAERRTGYSSMDTDVEFVNNLETIIKELGYKEKTIKKGIGKE